jgi:hypothetical protein
MRPVRGPGLPRRPLGHRVRHGVRNDASAPRATDRTDRDRGARRRHRDPERRKIAPLALFIASRRDIWQGRLAMSTAGDRRRDEPLRMLCGHQRLARMARLATLALVTSLPQAWGPLRWAIAVT